ncbi:MAG TPA: Gfo/Idh/MocA family oxidoreductase [Gemmataceae bacterium]|nr:Gfo/Idh/MocA family oxidoreductase [Gemmataceae bacterium]
MRNGRLQVGIVGVGGIGRDQHLPGWAKVPFAQTAAAADLAEAALARACQEFGIPRQFHDWHELVALPELDIIDICTPNRTHTAIALAALQNHKHVLCEKPLATSSAEVRLLAEACRQSGKSLMTGQHLRFDPAAQQLKSLIDAGMLGDVYYARGQWLRRRLLPPRPTFIERRLSGGGVTFDIGVHVLDLAYWFMGRPEPLTVSAMVDTKLAHRADLSGEWGAWDHARIDVDDFAAGFVRFKNGATLTLEVSWLGFQPERELIRLQCFGSRGGAVWPDGVLAGESNRVPWDLRLRDVAKIAPHHEEIYQFAVAVRDGLPSPIPVEDALHVVRILEAFYRSSHERREVSVE